MEAITGTEVPTWVMVLVTSVLTLSLFLGVPLARIAGRRHGRRLAHPELYLTKKEKAKDTALFLAALVPSVLVWLAVMGVSFIGLTGFAADVMNWTHWTNMLVPFSLDGISVSFGAWAFVAVKRGRHPGRAYKIVLAAAAMSAVLNFVHGRSEWSLWAGLYLAFLSFAGMAMFHELLEQFMASYDDEIALKSRYPRFGQRWFYAPFSTFAARRAWIVHPPREPLRPTVRNALEHLENTREERRLRRLGGAYLVREEQQAKLVEIHARNEVKAARRGQEPASPLLWPVGLPGADQSTALGAESTEPDPGGDGQPNGTRPPGSPSQSQISPGHFERARQRTGSGQPTRPTALGQPGAARQPLVPEQPTGSDHAASHAQPVTSGQPSGARQSASPESRAGSDVPTASRQVTSPASRVDSAGPTGSRQSAKPAPPVGSEQLAGSAKTISAGQPISPVQPASVALPDGSGQPERAWQVDGLLANHSEPAATLVEAAGLVPQARAGLSPMLEMPSLGGQQPGVSDKPQVKKPAKPELPAAEVDKVFDRLRKELAPDLALAPAPDKVAAPDDLAPPRPKRQRKAATATDDSAAKAEPETEEPVRNLPLPEQMRREQRMDEPIAFFRGRDERPMLPGRVRAVLESHVRPGDDLSAPALTTLVLRALGGPANRDDVSREVLTWTDEINQGARNFGTGKAAKLPDPAKNARSLEYPFELIALQPVTVGNNVVSCPECGTTQSLQFSGLHSRRPVDARCGCGRRWPIVGLGSSRVWEILADEVASGQALLIAP